MRLSVNGEAREVQAATLDALLAELGYEGAVVATAVNAEFVRSKERNVKALHEDDRIEILTPRQGG
jgi:sulfur carrier protein